MANPDLREYVDLTLFDVDPQDAFDDMVETATETLPDWVPAEGQTEVVLAELTALKVAEQRFAINRLPNGVAAALFGLLGVDLDPGVPPTATLRITIAGPGGVTIPAGTRVSLDVPGREDPLVLATDTGLVFALGESERTVQATATESTDVANGLPAGTAAEVLDRVLYVETVTLDEIDGGRDPETDTAWRTRAVQRLARLTETLVIPEHFTAAALERADVGRASTLDLYDPDAGGAPGDHAGHVTVALLGADGELLDEPTRDEIAAELQVRAGAHLAVHTIDATVTAVDVTVTVVRTDDTTDAIAEQAVLDALDALLDPLAWPFTSTVRRNMLLSVLGGLDPIAYVDTLDVPAADLDLPGVAPLTTVGVVDVTVLGPEDVA